MVGGGTGAWVSIMVMCASMSGTLLQLSAACYHDGVTTECFKQQWAQQYELYEVKGLRTAAPQPQGAADVAEPPVVRV